MTTGFINRIIEVLGLLTKENKRLQTENAILRIVLRNLIDELSEAEKEEINKLIAN